MHWLKAIDAWMANAARAVLGAPQWRFLIYALVLIALGIGVNALIHHGF